MLVQGRYRFLTISTGTLPCSALPHLDNARRIGRPLILTSESPQSFTRLAASHSRTQEKYIQFFFVVAGFWPVAGVRCSMKSSLTPPPSLFPRYAALSAALVHTPGYHQLAAMPCHHGQPSYPRSRTRTAFETSREQTLSSKATASPHK